MFTERSLESGYDTDWQQRVLASAPDIRPSVYFIAWDGGPIKIGHARDVRHRLHQIQAHCPFDLKILATREGGRDLERFYHDRFRLCRLRGEWFEPDALLLREIGKLNGTVHGHAMLFPPRNPKQ